MSTLGIILLVWGIFDVLVYVYMYAEHNLGGVDFNISERVQRVKDSLTEIKDSLTEDE